MRYVIDTKGSLYRTDKYEIKDGFVYFTDKFGAEIVINTDEVKRIRETKA